MLHFIFGLVISTLSVSAAWAKCDDSSIRYIQSSSFGLNWGPGKGSTEFGTEVTVNIPLVIDGKPACYHQKNAISVKTEKMKEGESVEYEITPLMAEFENVPEPEAHQYLNIEYDPDYKASKVSMMSFLCSGETPIGGDAFSDSLISIAENKNEVDQTVEIFIATGQAAENISVNAAKKAKAKVFDKFLEIYESRSNHEELSLLETNNIYIPNVISGMMLNGVSSVERKLYSSFFSRTNSSINGCSKSFLNKMQDLLLKNVVKNQPFKGIEIKKKSFSSRYKMKWTL